MVRVGRMWGADLWMEERDPLAKKAMQANDDSRDRSFPEQLKERIVDTMVQVESLDFRVGKIQVLLRGQRHAVHAFAEDAMAMSGSVPCEMCGGYAASRSRARGSDKWHAKDCPTTVVREVMEG